MNKISTTDYRLIQQLAREVKQIAGQGRFEAMRKEWIMFNDSEGIGKKLAPRVLIYPDDDGAWKELIPTSLLKVKHPFLRSIEFQLRRKIYRDQHFHDDFVIEPLIRYDLTGDYTGYHYGNHNQKTAWGLAVHGKESQNEGGSYALETEFNSQVDIETFCSHKLDFIVDQEEAEWNRMILEDAVGDILEIEAVVPYSVLVCSLVIELVHVMGYTNMLMKLMDDPILMHRIMNHMANQKNQLLEKVEQQGLLRLNNRDDWTGAGGVGYSSRLLKGEAGADSSHNKVKLSHLWGFADAQEYSDVSVDMWREFAFYYQAPLLRKFGYSSYGCCEKLDGRYEDIFSNLPNLKRVSVSPWANIYEAADFLKNTKYIYSRKPNPVDITDNFNEENYRNGLKEMLELTRDCNVEFILKDLRTCRGNPENLHRWVDITQEMAKR
ncbi:MAG: hypothetical protein HQ557_13530 [Bacteroidetes bacterium]|nr:hypothetical protein [Bacteroidota bacterium]